MEMSGDETLAKIICERDKLRRTVDHEGDVLKAVATDA